MIGAGQRKNRDKKPNRKAEKAKSEKVKKQIRKSWKFWRDNRYDCICQRDIGE